MCETVEEPESIAMVWKEQRCATAEELASQKTRTSQLSQLAVELVGNTLQSVSSLTPQSQSISPSLPDHLVSATLKIDQLVLLYKRTRGSAG